MIFPAATASPRRQPRHRPLGAWRAIAVAATVNFMAVHQAWADTSAGAPTVGAGALVKLTIGLALVLGAILALSWFLRRVARFPMSGGGELRVLGGVSVGSREKVVLLQVGKTQLLVGVAPGRVQTLHVLDEPLETRASRPAKPGRPDMQSGPFADKLRRMMQRQPHEKQ